MKESLLHQRLLKDAKLQELLLKDAEFQKPQELLLKELLLKDAEFQELQELQLKEMQEPVLNHQLKVWVSSKILPQASDCRIAHCYCSPANIRRP